MALHVPGMWLEPALHPGSILRLQQAGLLGSAIGAFAGGVNAQDPAHGVVGAGALAIAANGTPNLTVKVAAGSFFIRGTESQTQGAYFNANLAEDTITGVPAGHATNPTWHLVIVQARNVGGGYSGANDDFRFTIVPGTPNASPSDPSLAAYPNALVLARIVMPAGATNVGGGVGQGSIVDLRTFAGSPSLITSTGAVSFTSTSSVSSTFRYRRILGTTIEWECDWTITGGSSGTMRLVLPVPVASPSSAYTPVGTCTWLDNGTGRQVFDVLLNSDIPGGQTCEFNFVRGNYTSVVTNTSPANLAIGDVYHANGRYRAARA